MFSDLPAGKWVRNVKTGGVWYFDDAWHMTAEYMASGDYVEVAGPDATPESQAAPEPPTTAAPPDVVDALDTVEDATADLQAELEAKAKPLRGRPPIKR